MLLVVLATKEVEKFCMAVLLKTTGGCLNLDTKWWIFCHTGRPIAAKDVQHGQGQWCFFSRVDCNFSVFPAFSIWRDRFKIMRKFGARAEFRDLYGFPPRLRFFNCFSNLLAACAFVQRSVKL
jgi:hypothetical protein